MNRSIAKLFVVTFAARPTATNKDFRSFSWALLRLWLMAENADHAVTRGCEFLEEMSWKTAGTKCQVNLAKYQRNSISKKMQAAINAENFAVKLEGAPIGSVEPDFETLFRDPLTTKLYNQPTTRT